MKCQAVICGLVLSGSLAIAGEPTTAPSGYVSREEYEKLLHAQEQMRQEFDEFKRAHPPQTAPATGESAATTAEAPAPSRADLEAMNESIRDLKEEVEHSHGFDSRFVIVGDASFGYSALKGSPSTFSATVSPLVLWQPVGRVLVEAAADISVTTDANGTAGTDLDLTIGNASILVNDYLAVGAGLFVVPFGQFHNHFDPPWINVFPDDPLAFDILTPDSEVGAFVKGAVPMTVGGQEMKAPYDVYVANGPTLNTSSADAGSLNFQDFTDLNNNKAFGARFGLLPVSNLEVGYSFQASKPNPDGFKNVHALLQAVDFNWRQDVDPLSGWVNVRGEYVWSHLSQITYDPTGRQGFGPLDFANKRDGGYFQASYRPGYSRNKILRNFEFAARFDFLNTPLNSPGGDRERRVSLGVDYWITPQTVLELAYEFDHRKQSPSQSGIIIQLGLRL